MFFQAALKTLRLCIFKSELRFEPEWKLELRIKEEEESTREEEEKGNGERRKTESKKKRGKENRRRINKISYDVNLKFRGTFEAASPRWACSLSLVWVRSKRTLDFTVTSDCLLSRASEGRPLSKASEGCCSLLPPLNWNDRLEFAAEFVVNWNLFLWGDSCWVVESA